MPVAVNRNLRHRVQKRQQTVRKRRTLAHLFALLPLAAAVASAVMLDYPLGLIVAIPLGAVGLWLLLIR